MVGLKKSLTAKNIACFSVLLALVIVFQTCGGFIQIGGLSLSFVLVPIVLGGILLGWAAGGILGLVFGFIVLMYGAAGAEPFTAYLLANSPFMTVMICLVKGLAAGIVPALLYKAISRKNKFAAAAVAAASAPIMNTGIFIVGCLIISGTLTGWMEYAVSQGWMEQVQAVPYYLFAVLAGWNFIIELSVNLLLTPAIHRIVLVVEKQIMHKKKSAVPVAEGEADSENNAPQSEKKS